MEIIPAEDPVSLEKALEAIRAGGIIAYPTDTLYGLGVDAENAEAVERLYALKGRDSRKEVLIAVDGLQMASRYAIIDERAEWLAGAFMPGPLSLVLPRLPGSPTGIGEASSTIGIRIPNHPFVLALIEKLGHSITSTSVNKSGEPRLTETAPISEAFGHALALIIEDGMHAGPPSTVVDLTGPAPVVLREGVFPEAAILEALAGGEPSDTAE